MAKRMYSKEQVVRLIQDVVNEMLQASSIYLGDGEVLIDYLGVNHLADSDHQEGLAGDVLKKDANNDLKWINPEG